MRFTKYNYRPTDKREVTPRRIAASRRALNREAEKLPLFAAQIRETQPTPEERIASIDAGQQQVIAEWRTFRADMWRKGRAMLRELPLECQKDLIGKWNRGTCPADPAYFCDFVRTYKRTGFVWMDVPLELRFDAQKLEATLKELRERGKK